MYGLKNQLNSGRKLLGTFVGDVANPNICRIFAQAGLDFIILDNEHGSFNPETVTAVAAAAQGAGIGLVVRIAEIGREAIMKPLDAGADGLLIPMVDTPEQARQVIRHSRFPPLGGRGFHPVRPSSGFGKIPLADYITRANEEVFIAVQAETKEAVRNAGEIAALEGIDSIFIGPLDLSVGLGNPGQVDTPEQAEAMGKVVGACLAASKVPGIFCPSPEFGLKWAAQGVGFLAYQSDTRFLMEGARKGIQALGPALGR